MQSSVELESLIATPGLVQKGAQSTAVEIEVTLSANVPSRCKIELSVEGPSQAYGDVADVVFEPTTSVARTTLTVTPITDGIFTHSPETLAIGVYNATEREPATITLEDGDDQPISVSLSATINSGNLEIAAALDGEVVLAADSTVSLSFGDLLEPTTITIPATKPVGRLTIAVPTVISLLMPLLDFRAEGASTARDTRPVASPNGLEVRILPRFDEAISAITAEAVSAWAVANRPRAPNQRSRDYRYFLKKAYNIMIATVGSLSRSTLRELLGTADANKNEAHNRDTEQFEEAKELGTIRAYKFYLSSFPNGIGKEYAHPALDELSKRLNQQCGSFEDCPNCPKMMASGADNRIGPLAVGILEVTEDDFSKFSGDPRSGCWLYRKEANDGWAWRQEDWTVPSDRGEHPAICVSWNDARDYTGWLSTKTGKAYRLLTDDEWTEISAVCVSGGDRTHEDNFMSSTEDAEQCREQRGATSESRCPGGVLKGRHSKCNSIGIYDLHGNVWEWTLDNAEDGKDLKGVRGGSWVDTDEQATKTGRVFPEIRTMFTGFRIARTATACPGGVTLSGSETSGTETLKTTLGITAELDKVRDEETVVHVRFSGDAELGNDFTATADEIVIPSGKRSGRLAITIEDDELYENPETILVDGVAEGLAVTSLELRVEKDDRESGVALKVEPAGIYETGGPQVVTIQATRPSDAKAEPLEVRLGFDGIAVNGTDYEVEPWSPTITIPAGESLSTVSLTFTPIDDGVDEGVGETIEITGTVEDSHMVIGVISARMRIKERLVESAEQG